ncbi:MAG: T9SS type A sorting domain-containing protein [Bacteroidota bacterium]
MTKRLQFVAALAAAFLLVPAAQAQLFLSELQVNPPSTDSGNEYIEIQGIANSTIAANTYFINIEGDGSSSGQINEFFSLAGQTIGANGFLVIVPTGTPFTVEATANTADLGDGDQENPSATYMIATTSETLSSGLDLDADNDGTLDGTVGTSLTIVDAIAILDSNSDCAYASVVVARTGTAPTCVPAGAEIVTTGATEVDYVARRSNGIPKRAAADWFGGELTGSTVPNLALTTDTDDVFPSTAAGLALDNIGSSNASLPVELVSFEAIAGPDAIELSWSTATETNNAGFAIETSRGGDWHEIAWVNGFGTTLEAQNYRHTVVNLAPGRHQFRLRQVDFDGAFDYSPVVEATISVPGTHALSEAYPNPFNPQARFELTVATEQAVTVTLHDALGRTVRTLYTGVVAANATQSVLIDGSGLPSGLYVYRAAGASFAESRTVMLVK